MADKSLIEKLNQTDNSKITKFVKVLNEINDSSARTRVINLLNSIEQDIYILDSLNTNVDTNNSCRSRSPQKITFLDPEEYSSARKSTLPPFWGL